MTFGSTSPWRNSTKSKPRLEYYASLCLLSFFVCCVGLDLCLLDAALFCLSLPSCLSPTKGFVRCWLNRVRKHPIGEGMRDNSHTSLTEFSGDKVTNSSCPITLDNKQRLSSNVHVLSFHKELSIHLLFLIYSHSCTHACRIWRQWHGRVVNLIVT